MLLSVPVLIIVSSSSAFGQDEEIFSGPQMGEVLPAFEFRAVVPGPTEAKPGDNIDLVQVAKGGPVALLFLHEFTRPAIGMTRGVMSYAGKLQKKGLTAGVIYLHDDPTAAESQVNRARRALPENVAIGISNDGKEGPGAYGLNRNVAMTVLIANKGKIVANFALVQPSAQADGIRVATEIAKLMNVTPPTAEELGTRGMQRDTRQQAAQDPALRGLLAPIIQKDATTEEVDAAVAKLEEYVKDKPDVKKQVGDIARRIINAGRLDSYGTEAAQAHLKNWAQTWGIK
ncbi:MAG: hypothetical protein MPJ50_02570 [Pirellulales bacterium]|nr:hypothetical protein [Pirellulales bacterium]